MMLDVNCRAPGNFGADYPLTEENVKAQEITKIKEKKKKKKSNKDDGNESDAGNLDLNQEMYSLAHYISDQEELVNQMFSIIKGPKLEAMLPPILRSIPLHELKSLCLHELRGMSKKRIICIINGQEMEGSSESDEEEEVRDKVVGTNNKSDDSSLKKTVVAADRVIENTDSNQGIPAYLLKTIKVEDQEADSSGTKNSSGGKSVLELLELQMRARIIKTMLEKGDDGKALTEDAIVALMGTTAQSQVANAVSVVKMEKDTEAAEGQNNKDYSKGDKEMDKKKSTEEKRHRDDNGKHGRSGHKKEHHRRRGSKRQKSTEVIDSEEENEKKSRRDRSSEKRLHKKKKITRKEFEERMKRAKKNRSYRQRKSSEDEEKVKTLQKSESAKDEELGTENKAKDENLQNNDKKGEDGEIEPEKDGEAVSEKEEGEAVSEKEEGELDSDEEEEGACSPSDISSASYYSSSRSYTSRSRSRSYSRSWSRSPVRRRGRGKGRGRGRSRSRSRSWTRSRSRSRSTDRRKRDVGRAPKRTRRDNRNSGNVKMSSGIVSLPSTSNNKQQKEEEDNWGQSCDIEFVDSEEDFDDNAADSAKTATVNSKKPLPMKGQNSERASISFSFQKKTVPSITPNVDLDDLPLKSSSLGIGKEIKISDEGITPNKDLEEPDEIINLDSPKMPSDEILISSDSEQEVKDIVKVKSVRVEKREQLHAVKVAEFSKGKEIAIPRDGSAHLGKADAVVSNGNQASMVTFEETELQVRTKSNDELRTLVKKLDADNMQKSKEDSTKSFPCISSNSGMEIEQEACTKQGDSAAGEKINQSERIEVKPHRSEETGKEERDFVNNVCSVGEDQDLLVAKTLSTVSENSGNFCQVDITSDSDKTQETVLPKTDASNVSENLHGIDIKENTSEQEYEKICLDTSETLDKGRGQPYVISNESDSKSELTNKQALCGVSQAMREKEEIIKTDMQKPYEVRAQRVILEHLQDSYNEEQDSNQESSNEDQRIITKPNVENVTTDFLKEKSPEEKDKCEEPINDTIEVNEGLPAEVNRENKQGTVKGEDWNVHEKTGERMENYNSDKKERGSEYLVSNDDCGINKPSTDDFYRGADELTFSDDDDGNEGSEEVNENKAVEPIRINTGLIRKRIPRTKKVEMEAPGKSWTKKEKKKKEKPKDVLAMEGIGLLKKTLIESVQSPSSREEEEESHMDRKEIGEQTNDDDTCTSWGISSVSSKEETSMDSRVQSPKENAAERIDASPSSENYENNEMPDTSSDQKKNAQNTEIIGVIEAISQSDVNQMDDIDIGGSSWSMRWLQSEKVQKVVSSSKMLSRVRKKIQKKDKATKVVTTTEKPFIPAKKIPDPVVPIIGSIEEYERLFGMKAKKPNEEAADAVDGAVQESHTPGKELDQPSSAVVQESQKKRTNFGSDDEGEDSEEEALWSKILGK
ncbi:uncharacterized protein LOC135220499 [Macrobrachium nipponense]|uniref:uncharacterized protein LOC135220499 n=1 Tax=Macrobrachium nipponense TaxID=159736 RepID=UPI0030C860B4